MAAGEKSSARRARARIAFLAAVILVIAGLLSSATAQAATACSGTLSNTSVSALDVPAGATCVLRAVSVNSTMTVEGALDASGGGASHFNSSMTITGGSAKILGGSIAGSLKITGTPAGSLVDIEAGQGTGMTIGGTVLITGNAGTVRLANATMGAVAISGNSGPVSLVGDHVNGSLSVKNNTGGVTLSGNAISGAADCSGNAPQPSDRGAANGISGAGLGQCAPGGRPGDQHAVDHAYQVTENQTLVVPAPGVLAGSTDGAGRPLSAVPVSGPSNGTLTLNPDGSFTYTPATGFHGTDSFTYTANDGLAASNVATATIQVNGPPVAVNDSYDVLQGGTLAVVAPGVLANDSDPSGLPLTAVLGTGPSHGTLTLNSDGSFSYTPTAGFHGTDSFTYTAHDAFLGSNVATVTIHVRAPPVAVNDSYDVNQAAVLNVAAPGVLGNDSDPEGLAMTAVLGSGPAHGSLTLNADGSFTYTPTAAFSGTDSFTYTAHDVFQGSNTATVTIRVHAPPVAVNDSYDVNTGATLTVAAGSGVLANDTDPGGLPLTAVLGTGPSHGTLTLNADGSFTYTPTAAFQGSDSFTYTAHDVFQGSNTATVTIHVHAPPVAVNDSYDVNQGAVLTVAAATGVLANDSDPGGLPLSAVLGTGPAHGTLTLNSDGSFTYTPTAVFSGNDSFTYTAHDTFQGSNTATVTIHVHAPPVAVDDSYDVNENGNVSIAAPGVLGNDTDPGGLALTAVLGAGPTHGLLTLNANGSFTYTPTVGFSGNDSFTYTAHDTFQGSNTATVTIHVHAPPVAVNDSYDVNENATLTVVAASGVLANDSDPGGLPMTAVLGAGPAHGSLTLNADGSFTYTPTVGFSGNDSFTYTAHDAFQGSNTATVTIHVHAPPVAVNDSYDVNQGAVLTVAAAGVLANDTDPGGLPLSAVLGTGPAHGTLTLNSDGSFTYTPTAAFSGNDSFTYVAQDAFQSSNTATVTIHVHAPPVAVNDSYDVNENGNVSIAAPGVLGNDTDPGGLALTAVLGAGPAHGSLTLNANGSFAYTPTVGFSGSDSFTYTAHDVFQGSNTATVTIHVHAPPVAVNDSYSVNKNATLTVVAATGVLANDTDPGGLPLTAVLGTGPSHGTLTLNSDGSFTYVPTTGFNGSDSFTYTAHDAFQGSNTATVTILVGAPPVAVNDSYDVNEGATLTVAAATGVLANDTDPNGLPLTAVLGTGPSHGTLTLNSDGSFTYVPAAAFSGDDSFTYVAQDSLQSSNTATVTIHVQAPPVANNDSYDVAQGGTLTVAAATGVLANDTDPGGLPLTAVLGAGPSHGSLTLNADGSFTYTPTALFSGDDTFTYTAHDSFQGSNTATVTIHVHAPPVAVNDSYTTRENVTLTVAAATGVLANDSDPGGLPLTAVLGTGPTSGSLTLNADGSFVYAPTNGFSGTDSFTYTAHDAFAGSNTATVTITVLAPPVAVDDTYGTSVATAVVNNAATAIPRVGEHGVLFNDTDVNGFALTVTQIGAGPTLIGTTTLGATVTMNANGTFTYDPTTAPAGGTLKTLAVGATATDTFTYTISDGHGGTASATVSVLVTHPDTPPVANPLAVNAIGNTLLEYGTQAAASNEPKTTAVGTLNSLVSDPDSGDSATVTAVDTTSTGGGSIVWDSATGGFAYRAAAGFTGTDTFHYTATDTHAASTQGTVTVTVASKVWYVKNNAAGNDGRSGSPFKTLAQAQSASGSGDTIYVFGGDGTSTGQSVGIVLKSNQRLIGQADVLTIGATALFPATPASRPLLTASSGAGVTLASGTTVEGLSDNPSGTAAGISGDNSVAGATIDDVRVASSGSGEGVTLTGSTGTIALTNSTVSSGTDDAVLVTQPSGTLNLTLTGDTLTEANVSGNDALNITSTGSATVNPTISGTTINAARGDLFQLNIGDSSSSTLSFMNNTLSDSNTNIVSAGGGVTITAGGGTSPHATLNFDIQHNTFRDSLGNAVGIGNATGTNTMRGTFSNNTVGVAAVANSGSVQGSDVSVAGVGGGSIQILVEHNNVYQYNNFGITFQTTSTFALDAKIDNNTVASPGTNPGAFFGSGLQLNAGTTTGDTNAVCFDAFANSITGSGFGGGVDYKVRQRQSTTVRLPNYGGSTVAAVEAFMTAQQTPNTPTTLATQAGTIAGGTTACNTP